MKCSPSVGQCVLSYVTPTQFSKLNALLPSQQRYMSILIPQHSPWNLVFYPFFFILPILENSEWFLPVKYEAIFLQLSWWLKWKPLKSIKLSKNQNSWVNASARLHFKRSNLSSLSCKALLLPSQPFASGTWFQPENVMNKAGSTDTIPVQTGQILYFPANPSSWLWGGLQVWRPWPAPLWVSVSVETLQYFLWSCGPYTQHFVFVMARAPPCAAGTTLHPRSL